MPEHTMARSGVSPGVAASGMERLPGYNHRIPNHSTILWFLYRLTVRGVTWPIVSAGSCGGGFKICDRKVVPLGSVATQPGKFSGMICTRWSVKGDK